MTHKPNARLVPRAVNGATMAVILGLAGGLAALAVAAGSSPMAAGLVASATVVVGWWAVATEP